MTRKFFAGRLANLVFVLINEVDCVIYIAYARNGLFVRDIFSIKLGRIKFAISQLLEIFVGAN